MARGCNWWRGCQALGNPMVHRLVTQITVDIGKLYVLTPMLDKMNTRVKHVHKVRDPLEFRILLVDDHPIVRNGIRAVLDGEPDLEVVGEARNLLQAISGGNGDQNCKRAKILPNYTMKG